MIGAPWLVIIVSEVVQGIAGREADFHILPLLVIGPIAVIWITVFAMVLGVALYAAWYEQPRNSIIARLAFVGLWTAYYCFGFAAAYSMGDAFEEGTSAFRIACLISALPAAALTDIILTRTWRRHS